MSFEPTNEDAIRQSAFADGEAYAEARIIKWLVEKDRPNRKPCSHSNGCELPCGGCNVFLEPNEVIAFIEGETE